MRRRARPRRIAQARIDRRSLKVGAGAVAGMTIAGTRPSRGAPLKVEKEEPKPGFIKLTDMAPLAIAKELGFFEDEGLFVTLEVQANWKVLLDRGGPE